MDTHREEWIPTRSSLLGRVRDPDEEAGWRVSATDLPLTELTLFAEVFAGGRLTQAGLIESSTPAEWEAAWRRLRAHRPALFTASDAEIAAWHARQAQASERAERWSAAHFHLHRLLALGPDNPELRRRVQAVEAKGAQAGTD